MNSFPVSLPVPIPTGHVKIYARTAHYDTPCGEIEFCTIKNPIKILDGENRQWLMQSEDGNWFLETNSGGIDLLFVRLFHQTYLMKLPLNHELIPKN